MFLPVRQRAEPMTHEAMQTQGQGQTSGPWDSVVGDLAVLKTAVLYQIEMKYKCIYKLVCFIIRLLYSFFIPLLC